MPQTLIKLFKLAILSFTALTVLKGTTPSAQSFEVRYFTNNAAANGETDFKGKSEFLDTNQRIAFLRAYADYGRLFWMDPMLDKEVCPLAEAKAISAKIKPQPRPKVRLRILDDEWAWFGRPSKQTRYKEDALKVWLQESTRVLKDGNLIFLQDSSLQCQLPGTINWRGHLSLSLDFSKTKGESTFALGKGIVVGFDREGRFFYISEEGRAYPPVAVESRSVVMELDLDCTTRRFNVRLNGQLVADYVSFSNPKIADLSCLEVKGSQGMALDEVYAVAYIRQDADPHYPYTIKPLLDLSFDSPVSTEAWTENDYDDAAWKRACLPIVHGGERYAGESLLLRKTFVIESPESWSQALLNLETVVPSGTLYVNGKAFEVFHSAKPRVLDVLKALKAGKNVIALEVEPHTVPKELIMTHTNTDRNTGWFAGRIHLDLLKNEAIDDVHVNTSKLTPGQAVQNVEVTWHSDRANTFSGKLRITLAPWFPAEGPPVAVQEFALSSIPKVKNQATYRLQIDTPALWTSESPNLYLAKVELLNENGAVIDDWVLTTGIRTVSQEGGVFRINGKPELLKAPLLFGCRAPLGNIARWDKCPPMEYLVQELSMIRRMNGNGVRMSVHDSKTGGINDPRIAEIADQLGLMLIWQTSAWLREDIIHRMDFDLLSEDVHLVRNHPSIVIWQPSNHPKWSSLDHAMLAYRRIHEAITRWDRTRLISPSADFRFLNPPNDAGTADSDGRPIKVDPIWTDPLITRGSMDYICGYGNTWTALRKFPDWEEDEKPLYFTAKPFQRSFMESKERAYFNFEHDESAGQPNWSLIKGQPYYLVPSYEADYDIGSIGRLLRFDEWDLSQAWQALISYESIKKMKLFDYDGFSWCCLRGGSNMATYQKPLLDYEGVAKLAFYAHRTVFQNTFAGSDNVDMVYGPADMITPVIFHQGQARTVSLSAELLTPDGNLLESLPLGNIKLEAGRNFIRGNAFRFKQVVEGPYVVKYRVD